MDDHLKRVAQDLAPSGVLRAAINFGNTVLVQRDRNSGEPRGVASELAEELARRLGLSVRFIPFETAGAVSAAAASDVWDIAFLAVDPKRAVQISFTPPYVLIEGTYVVNADSPLKTVEDVDRAGIRIAVGLNAAYDLYLTRTLKHAELLRCDGSQAGLDRFLEDGLEAAAGIRQALNSFADSHAGLRVMDESFMTIRQAMATPKDRAEGARYLVGFVEEMKASGFVEDALTRSGQADARVAPPAQSGD